MNTSEWEIKSRREMSTGTYFALNVRAIGNPASSTVTVKARGGLGEPYVCLSCLKNDCPHIDYVKLRDDAPENASDVTLSGATA